MSVATQPEISNRLKSFCEACASRNHQSPLSEEQLAEAFVKFFSIPPLFDVSGLDKFFATADIEMCRTTLPVGLLGLNMSYEGKRKIRLSDRRGQKRFQLHTALHEIRELIENDFRVLGFSTTESSEDELEFCADEFAFHAVLCSQAGLFRHFFANARAIKSDWRRWAILSLIGLGMVAAGLFAFIGAFYPHVTVTGSKIRFER